MQEPSQESPKPRNSAGYRPLVPAELTRGTGNAAAAYVAAAAGLGLMVGVVVAFTAGRAQGTDVPRVSEALATHTSGLTALPAAYTGPAPSLLNRVEPLKKADAGSPLPTPVRQDSTTKAADGHKKHRMHRRWPWRKGKHNGAKRAPYVSPNPPAPADSPTALEMATAAAANGPFFVGIEGEVTVAGYDVADGKIQTYEGSKFILDKGAVASGAIPWQDFPFNVHYRCDESGNCTLVRGGATEIARLTR
jgi:hypothetical protein